MTRDAYEEDREAQAVKEENYLGPEICCSHELADGSPAGRLNLGACSVECAICGEQLISLNFLVAPELSIKH